MKIFFMFRVCHAVFIVLCRLVIICWEPANLLVLLYVMFSCGFVSFLCGVLGQVWCLIVSIPDFCILPHIVITNKLKNKQTVKAEDNFSADFAAFNK